MKTRIIAVGVAAACSLMTSLADAAIVPYLGMDPGVGPGGAHPSSSAARAAFLGAITPTGSIDFEGSVPGFAPFIPVGGGNSVTLFGPLDPGLSGVTVGGTTDLGYDTTFGGTGKFLRIAPHFSSGADVFAVFAFSTPIHAFGAFLTGTEIGFPGPITVKFSDGVVHTLPVFKNPPGGGVQFFGFTSDGLGISSVSFSEGPTADGGRDIWGIDDVVFSSVPVPEPSTYLAGALLLLPFGLQGLRSLRNRKKVA